MEDITILKLDQWEIIILFTVYVISEFVTTKGIAKLIVVLGAFLIIIAPDIINFMATIFKIDIKVNEWFSLALMILAVIGIIFFRNRKITPKLLEDHLIDLSHDSDQLQNRHHTSTS